MNFASGSLAYNLRFSVAIYLRNCSLAGNGNLMVVIYHKS